MTTSKIQRGAPPTNKHLVTFSSVPVRIDCGSFILTENELEYFKLLNNEMNTLARLFTERETVIDRLLTHKDMTIDLHMSMPLNESIPSRPHLTALRRSLRMLASSSSGSSTLNNPIVELAFEGLYIEFNRKHNGGGNGIIVNVDTLCINELKMNETAAISMAYQNINSPFSPRSPTDTIHMHKTSSKSTATHNSHGGGAAGDVTAKKRSDNHSNSTALFISKNVRLHIHMCIHIYVYIFLCKCIHMHIFY